MAQAMAKYSIPSAPNSSTLRITEAMGQFTAPQNTATRPMAAVKAGGRPSSEPTQQPKVAPTKKEGTTSPPLKPQPMVTAVNSSFKSHAQPSVCPLRARVMTSMPAPL